MSHTRPQPSRATPDRALGEWRRRRLMAAGVDAALATRLTQDSALDLHELLVLLDRGCPPHLAARIIAPLDTPPGQ